VADHVIFHDRYVDSTKLNDFLGADDVYVTPCLPAAARRVDITRRRRHRRFGCNRITLMNTAGVAVWGRVDDVFDTSGDPMAVLLNGRQQSLLLYWIPTNGTLVLAPRDANGQSPF
jgi:hypothetical protein